MVFVVDDIAAWLAIGEAGRKKLIEVVLGSEQERALHSAASAAVQRTATRLCHDGVQAEHLAQVINEIFAKPMPSTASMDSTTSLSEALRAGIAAQLAVLDDASLIGTGTSSAEALGVPAEVLADELTNDLFLQIKLCGARGGALSPLTNQINHDVTHSALDELRQEMTERLTRLEASRQGPQQGAESTADAVLRAEQLLEGLELGDHDEAQRRVHHLFIHLYRDQQRAVVEATLDVATSTADDLVQHHACSLLEAADRLDPLLIKPEEVELLARSREVPIRMSAAMLLWQRAESDPGHVPVSLLGRLTRPSNEDWYVQTPARAAAKQLILRRAAARAIFDRMAASHDPDDREYAARDLLEVAEVEPRAVPADLAERLLGDDKESVAALAAKLRRIINGVDEDARRKYYSAFGL